MKRENYKIYLFVVGLSLILLLNLSFVSAQGNDIIDNIYNQLGPAFASIFAPIFGPNTSSDFLFAKILLFILFFAVIFMALKNVKIFRGKNNSIRIIISLIVAILSARYLKETDFARALLLPYGALGGAIAILLPLIIYFFFVHTSFDGGFGRRFAWFIYGVIFLFLWGNLKPSIGNANWIYIAGLVFVLINLIFDKAIHSYFEVGKLDRAHRNIMERQMLSYMKSQKDALDVGNDELAEKYKDKARDLAKRL